MAVAAALWGTDGLLRLPLAEALPAAAVVLAEHLLVVGDCSTVAEGGACPARVRPAGMACRARDRGWASAPTTALFAAFQSGEPVTPLVLPKSQPLFAMLAAFFLLGKRLHGGYVLFALPALLGAWWLSFADPTDVRLSAVRAAVLALGSAAPWAAGTALARMVSAKLRAADTTVLRFAVGLPGDCRGGAGGVPSWWAGTTWLGLSCWRWFRDCSC